MKSVLLKLTLCAFLSVSFNSVATEIIHYDNLPVTVHLHVGSERSIQFGDHVKVGVTKGQQIKKLFRVQAAQGVVHLLAYEEFDKQRIQVKRITDGRVILLDVIAEKSGSKTAPLENLKVLLDSENSEIVEKVVQGKATISIVTPVDLTRFAAQKLYGPTRLHNDVPGITEAILGIDEAIRIFKGVNKINTVSKPVVAYQGGGLFLAGIHIKNISGQAVDLNYLELNLPFSHATFQHHQLHPHGMAGDSTMLYLLSEKPLKETLYPWSYYQDLRVIAERNIAAENSAKKTNNNPYRHGFK